MGGDGGEVFYVRYRAVVMFQNHLSRQLFHLSRISRLYYSIHVTSARDRASGMQNRQGFCVCGTCEKMKAFQCSRQAGTRTSPAATSHKLDAVAGLGAEPRKIWPFFTCKRTVGTSLTGTLPACFLAPLAFWEYTWSRAGTISQSPRPR